MSEQDLYPPYWAERDQAPHKAGLGVEWTHVAAGREGKPGAVRLEPLEGPQGD